MKTLVIMLITAAALVPLADARDFMWFQGDIGVNASPFVSLSSPTSNVTSHVVTEHKVVTKRIAASSGSVAKTKSKSTRQRLTAH
jgi:hypothetical protein